MSDRGYELPLEEGLVNKLPLDLNEEGLSRQTPGVFGSIIRSQCLFPDARLLAYSSPLASTLGVSQEQLISGRLTPLLSGQSHHNAKPYAQCYGGFQFGHWAGQLGDGRVTNLGDIKTESGSTFELQLKGAGLTPYSRTADGAAVMRSSIREYLASEAMFFLEIPTSRALSLVSTGADVLRDRFYDGHESFEPGAIVARVAPSFIRFGTFDLPASREEYPLLKQIADVTIERHFPQLQEFSEVFKDNANRYVHMFARVVERTAEMIALWQSIGFVHGVMNTDNMSILGITIDYGPYAFMDRFDPNFTPNTSDLPGRRYCYGRQFAVGAWNLQRLAESMSVLMPQSAAESVLKHYEEHFIHSWRAILKRKFGFKNLGSKEQSLANRWFELLQNGEHDINERFRSLSTSMREDDSSLFLESVADNRGLHDPWKSWLEEYRSSFDHPKSVGQELCLVNPKVILHNHLLHQVIEQTEAGDLTLLHKVNEMIQRPYEDWEEERELLGPRPHWADSKNIAMNSCSS